MSQQTAVEWLATRLLYPDIHNPYIEKALEIEKQQIIDAYEDAYMSGYRDNGNNGINYYNETFKLEVK
jgi:hypothetical protein